MVKKYSIIFIFIAIVFAAFAASNLTGNLVKQETIKIGVTLPLTGPIAVHGSWVQRGIELSKEEINSNGGIDGKLIETIYEDDKCQPNAAVTNTHKLLDLDNVKTIVSFCSAVTPSVAPIAKDKAIVFSPAAFSDPVVEAKYDHVFTTQPPLREEMKRLAEYIFSQGLKKLSIAHVQNDLGFSYSHWLQEEFKSLGGKIILVEKFNLLDTDFRTQLTKIKNADTEALFIANSGEGLGRIVNQAKELRLETKLFGATISESAPFLKVASENAEGYVYTYPLKLEQTEFSKKYKEKYGEDPEIYAANSYDAFSLMVKAFEKCKIQELDCMKSVSKTIEIGGASGKFKIKNGIVDKKIYLKTVKDGKFVYLD